jgi:hypothetical protein
LKGRVVVKQKPRKANSNLLKLKKRVEAKGRGKYSKIIKI